MTNRVRTGTLLVVALFALPPIRWTASAATSPAVASLSCGAIITESVKLTKDLLNCPVDGLVVGANGITIDLNGHRITGTFFDLPDDDYDLNRCYCGINDTAGFHHITLGGGVIKGFLQGAEFQDAHDIVVHDLISRGHWSNALRFFKVADVLVTDSQFSKSFRGVSLVFDAEAQRYNRRVTVRSSSFDDIEHAGIALFGTYDSVVRENAFALGGGEMGIEVANSSRNLMTQNRVRGWTADGVLLSACLCFDARPTERNSVIENDLRDGSSGIELVEVDGGVVRDNLVSGNTTTGTSDSGIAVYGLTSRSQDPHNASCPCDLVIGGGPSGNRINNNTSNGNALDGIHLDAPQNVVSGNVVNRNRRWGIFAAPGTVDGGGNQASRNGQPDQCIGVSCL
jgi:Right handed beta helix region